MPKVIIYKTRTNYFMNSTHYIKIQNNYNYQHNPPKTLRNFYTAHDTQKYNPQNYYTIFNSQNNLYN